jgi:HPt (histidine-containing phosphotransfer) domain-containing protein
MTDNNFNAHIQIDVTKVSQELRIRPEVYTKILRSFVDTLQQKVAMLHQALAAQDHETMRKILHEIKGTAGNLRLVNISTAEERLHQAVKSQEQADKLHEYTQTLQSESERLYQYVRQLVGS